MYQINKQLVNEFYILKIFSLQNIKIPSIFPEILLMLFTYYHQKPFTIHNWELGTNERNPLPRRVIAFC